MIKNSKLILEFKTAVVYVNICSSVIDLCDQSWIFSIISLNLSKHWFAAQEIFLCISYLFLLFEIYNAFTVTFDRINASLLLILLTPTFWIVNGCQVEVIYKSLLSKSPEVSIYRLHVIIQSNGPRTLHCFFSNSHCNVTRGGARGGLRGLKPRMFSVKPRMFLLHAS